MLVAPSNALVDRVNERGDCEWVSLLHVRTGDTLVNPLTHATHVVMRVERRITAGVVRMYRYGAYRGIEGSQHLFVQGDWHALAAIASSHQWECCPCLVGVELNANGVVHIDGVALTAANPSTFSHAA